jgi:hypothetical protein
MAQVDSKNTIAAPVDQTRRRFLSTAAGVAAGGTVLALASLPASAADDPVFALIETHRAASAALNVAIAEKARLEGLGDWDADGGTDAAHGVEGSALDDLIEAVPTTLAGVMANMRYIADNVVHRSGNRLGDDYVNPLLLNLAEALEGLAVTS